MMKQIFNLTRQTRDVLNNRYKAKVRNYLKSSKKFNVLILYFNYGVLFLLR